MGPGMTRATAGVRNCAKYGSVAQFGSDRTSESSRVSVQHAVSPTFSRTDAALSEFRFFHLGLFDLNANDSSLCNSSDDVA